MTSASTKVDLQSLPPTREGYKTTHPVELQDIRCSNFFLRNDYSKAFEYHGVLLVRLLRNKYVKLVSTTFYADTSLKKCIHQFSLLRLNADHQNSICWLRVEEPQTKLFLFEIKSSAFLHRKCRIRQIILFSVPRSDLIARGTNLSCLIQSNSLMQLLLDCCQMKSLSTKESSC